MKKILIGILVIIPVIILAVTALATRILIAAAHIPVEDIVFNYKDTENVAYNLSVTRQNIEDNELYIWDYIDVEVLPERANNYALEWRIYGDVICTDDEYEGEYKAYIEKCSTARAELESALGNGTELKAEYKQAYEQAKAKYLDSSQIIDEMLRILYGERVYPAACLLDDSGNEVSISTSGRLHISSFCSFTLEAVAENVSRTISISVVGLDVERVTLSLLNSEDNRLEVGESMRLIASYTPITSIVNHTVWHSSDSSVLSVDENGVVTAHRAGEATITLDAGVYSTEGSSNMRYVSGGITLGVNSEGVSSIYGNNIQTSRARLLLSELGLAYSSLEPGEGYTYDSEAIYLSGSDDVSIKLKNLPDLKLVRCEEGAIAIQNAALYESKSGYVLSVGENTLKLSAVWADMLKEGKPQGIVWSSSDKQIATVDANGVVTGLSDGFVRIEASDGRVAYSIELNVRKKLSSLQLRTSDASLAIGLAKETVFASMKYENNTDYAKQANYVYIIVQGQESVSDDELSSFYAAYGFEIVEGSEYAYFDSVEVNKLVFTNALEGKGKQKIKVRAYAKYPKYESVTRFTEQEVTITAVYGVEASNIHELLHACEEQEKYAKAWDNLVNPSGIESFRNVIDEQQKAFVVTDAPYSKQLYSICLADNCSYGDEGILELDEKGNVRATIDYDRCAKLYGNLYGNNHMISAVKGQLDYFLVRAKWNGITISNVIMRATEVDFNSDNIDAVSASNFLGKCVDVDANIKGVDQNGSTIGGNGRASIENGGGITIEYSIFENARQGVNLYNVDVNMIGCVLRNMAETAMYVPTKMDYDDEMDEQTGYELTEPYYSHLNMHNIICSNTIGSMITVSYESFTYLDGGKNSKGEAGHGRFVYDDLAANEAYYLEHFYPKGINCVINQTGFYAAYNWQDLNNATLIDFGEGNEKYTNMIGSYAGQIILNDPLFEGYRLSKNDKNYVHYAIIASGISTGGGELCLSEPNYLEFNMQSNDLYELALNRVDKNAHSGLVRVAAAFVQTTSLKVYSYKNDNPIQPEDTYQLNAALIERLHT